MLGTDGDIHLTSNVKLLAPRLARRPSAPLSHQLLVDIDSSDASARRTGRQVKPLEYVIETYRAE